MLARYAAIVRDHRAMIVLLAEEPESGSPEATAAWLLHERLQDNLEALTDMAATPTVRDQLLDKLENDPTLRDGDKLAFLDLLDDVPASPRVEHDRQVLLGIRNRYDGEIKKLLSYLPTRGLADKREAWDAYLAFAHATLPKDAILAEWQVELASLGEGTRGGAVAWKDDKDQIVGRRFPEKTLLLTFDDGPAKQRTPAVLEVLQRYGIKAVFFQVGKNVKKASDLDGKMVAAGHTLGNHTFDHAFLPKLGEPKLEQELTDTNQALLAASKTTPALFRPPYGARNQEVIKDTDKLQMKTVLWNIDSRDWADPVPASIARRVLAQVAQQKRGILLFHDIHDRGMGLFRERRYQEAAQAFESALKSNPNNVLAANNLGFTYVKLDRLPEAITWYQKTLLLDPQRAVAHANLGDVYAKVGRTPEAKAEYTRFLDLKPDHKLAPTVRERLAKLP